MSFFSYCQSKYKSLDSKPLPKSVWSNPIHFIGCGFGIGALPLMPGTWATLFGILVYLLMTPLNLFFYILVCVTLNLIGVWLCEQTNRDFGEKDHHGACFDEIAAFPICFIGLECHWAFILIGFIVFRALDIFKPYPISYIEDNIKGGWGVILDDIAAALGTLVVLHIIALF